MARSIYIDPTYLTRIFNNSVKAENPYRTFRARVALASNPNCPKDIVEFLWANRDTANWLLRYYEEDYEEENVIVSLGGKYVINSKHPSIQEIKDEANLTLDFQANTKERYWNTDPGVQYVENLLDIQWEADSARTCLLAAFAKNTNLSQAQYADLYKETHPLVRYFLSKNPSLQEEIKVALVLESPTFSFIPYEDPTHTEKETLK
jgi:hypothetical protein